MIIGRHRVGAERSYSVHRFNGLATLLGTLAFGAAIMGTRGDLIGTPGWQPLLDAFDGHEVIGAWLVVCALLGFAGLAFDDDDVHAWPRRVSMTSAALGVAWFGLVAFGCTYAYLVDGWSNPGAFMAAPGALLHADRLYLFMDKPAPERPPIDEYFEDGVEDG